MKLFKYITLVAMCAFIFTGCGEKIKDSEIPVAEADSTQNAQQRKETVVLTERQKEILTELGLSTDYDELSDREKNAIEAIEYMLSYLENKYNESFVYAGYVEGRDLEKEHLKAYPENGSMNDEVIVYRTYEDGTFTCTDNYINILAAPVYQKTMEKYISNYFSEGTLYTEVVEVSGEEVPNEDTALFTITAGSTLLLDESAVTKEQLDSFVQNYSAMMRDNSRGMPSVMDIWLMDADTIKGINAYNYHDILLQADYSGVLTISVSSSGKVTTMESGF